MGIIAVEVTVRLEGGKFLDGGSMKKIVLSMSQSLTGG